MNVPNNIPLVNLKPQYKKLEKTLLPKVRQIFAEQKFTSGQYGPALEETIARYSGVPYAVTCANGTDALILALMALDIKAGDEVITTPYTFFSTASSVALVGAKPVFVDIKADDMNIDPALIERAITAATKAITVVHLFGRLCDMDAICEIAKRRGIAVVEDMAQSLGARRNGVASGAFGDIGTTSFYPTKNLGAPGEGGMVLTTRKDLYERTKSLRVHGMSSQTYHHELIGFNSRLDEIKSCALLEKFPYLEEWNKKRIANALYYNKKLRDLPIALPPTDGSGDHIFHQYVIKVEKRDELKAFLQQKGIASGIYYPLPLHQQDCFAYLGYRKGDFKVSEESSRTSMALPVFPELKRAEKDHIVNSIREFFRAEERRVRNRKTPTET
jgi:dTDP-4-amino-4,6-dideoxygalactose transaminase